MDQTSWPANLLRTPILSLAEEPSSEKRVQARDIGSVSLFKVLAASRSGQGAYYPIGGPMSRGNFIVTVQHRGSEGSHCPYAELLTKGACLLSRRGKWYNLTELRAPPKSG